MEKELKIRVPDGYEIDNENSTFECIKYKKKYEIRTWFDYAQKYGDFSMEIYSKYSFEDKKFINHLKAELKIKLLMPYYGGEITMSEWKNPHISKSVITSDNFTILRIATVHEYSLLAFHTYDERNDFLKYNEDIVKDYFMLND